VRFSGLRLLGSVRGPRLRPETQRRCVATTDEEFPDVNADPYELRSTWRALVDIGVHRETPAGALRTIMAASPWPDIVAEFIDQRALSPHTTGGHLARCGRGDIAELHRTSGGRAGTW
jgi:hypothetical protein